MKITYTSAVRGWHHRYAAEFHKCGCLHAFVTGASRLGHEADFSDLGFKLRRHDLIQTLHLAAYRYKLPHAITLGLGRAANRQLDKASLEPASESDLFLYYRTTGTTSAETLHRRGLPTVCVLEEVNSHFEQCHGLMKEEFERLNLGSYPENEKDRELRLRAYDSADYILCPSNFVKRSFMQRGFAEDRVIMVNFGFTFPKRERQTAARAADKEAFRLLYVGQIHFRKGLRYALEAFAQLKHPNKEFVIVGPMTKFSGLQGVTIPEGVRFLGTLKGEELDQAYASATAFVLPTIEEGLALVLGEAMGAGLPLITTTHSGGDDLVTHGVEGFIVPPCNVEALRECFQELADRPDLCAQMREAALEKARRLGGWDTAAAKIMDAFRGILNTARN